MSNTISRQMWNMFLVIAILCGSVDYTHGHFIWVAKSNSAGVVNIYFGEGPSPDQAQFLNGLKEMQVWSVDKNGVANKLDFNKKTEGSDGWFETASGQFAVDVDCQYGIFGRGDKNMFLHYSAKYIDYVPNFEMKPNGKLPLDITFKSAGSKTKFKVLHKGKPASSCELNVVDHKDENHELTTNEAGEVEFAGVPTGRWQVRAKVTDATAGKVGDKEYSEKRYYCTLVVGLDSSEVNQQTETSGNAESAKAMAKVSASTPFPDLPVGITSFGGAVVDQHVYVFGGHCGQAHNYYRSGQNGKLMRLDLKDPAKWETVGESTGLQGLAMVEHKGNLYRVGGFEARNKKGEDQDLHSVNDFAQFNFETKTWEPRQPMPTPRSSLDAVVIGDELFVVGGWAMKGSEKTEWREEAISINLADKDAKWNVIETPFKRRALSVGFQGNKLCAVGGMQEKGGITSNVQVYDIKSKTWTEGPKLPGSGSMEGFGSSCFNIGGKLIASTYSGEILSLNQSHDGWEKIHELETGRFFHRLLPMSQNKFMLVGGANMEIGKMHDVQVISLDQ